MFGNSPNIWSESLTNEDRLRYTINALMRLRFCDEYGKLDFRHKDPDHHPKNLKAWFLHSNRIMSQEKIFFGHWSSLKNIDTKNIYPLDHGCVWGGMLSAYNLTNEQLISQKSLES